MEQKHEHVEKQVDPKPGMWLPWLNLEEADPAESQLDVNSVPMENVESPLLIPPLPPDLLSPPSYFPATELNLKLAQMGRDTPWREVGLIGLWTCLVPLLSIGFFVSLLNGVGVGILGCGATLAFLLHYNRLIDSLNQTRAALSLSQFGKEWIGGFIEALLWPNARIQGIAAAALMALLPRLTPEDAALLTTQQREILHTRLHMTGLRTDFCIAILQALGAIGEEGSVPHMELLADTIAWTPRQTRIRTAAREALSVLEERLAQQRKVDAFALQVPPLDGAVVVTPEEISPEEQELRSKEAQDLLNKMEEESRSRRKPAMRIGFLIANWAVIVPYLGVRTLGSLRGGADAWVETLIWAILCLGSTQLYRFTLSVGMSEAARKLANTDDIRAVSTLAEALEWPDKDIQLVARKGLTRLLPRLRATDSNLLNEEQRHSLYKCLKMSNARKEEELIISILAALEQIGDNQAIPYVERLTRHMPVNAWEKRIRDRAQQCYPYLLTRAQANESSMMLLRASSATEISPEVLLRPAAPYQGEAAEELLRPSVDDK